MHGVKGIYKGHWERRCEGASGKRSKFTQEDGIWGLEDSGNRDDRGTTGRVI